MLVVRTLVFNFLFVITTVALSLAAAPGLLLPYKAVVWFKQMWLYVVLALTRYVMGIKWEMRGRGNIPDGPVIFAVKHQSAWDTMALSVTHPYCAFILKRELVRYPVWGWYLLRLGMIPIDRSKGMISLKKVAKSAGEKARRGQSVLIFPQGTRTPPGADRPYLPGVVAIYRAAKVPVVPVALNSGLFWPRMLMHKQPGTVTVEYLEPIQSGLDRETFMATLEARIEAATAKLEAEALDRFPHLPPLPVEATAAGVDAEPVESDARAV